MQYAHHRHRTQPDWKAALRPSNHRRSKLRARMNTHPVYGAAEAMRACARREDGRASGKRPPARKQFIARQNYSVYHLLY
ncbi:hypothetical protein EVAR_70764_1 [Eumeta japonica]|uniref:Uncharacterized protein n=1 Tax=Eumeta variegata TaxID=151549 RepID=A0A4C1ZYB9_EUMVA|nr:hypothetical protein EVAR_70764_1 [Eumeta japonica]